LKNNKEMQARSCIYAIHLSIIAALTAVLFLKIETLSHRQTKVVVIGAGFTGLSAARRLAEQGYSVEVLETKPRPGGRIVTHYGWGTSRTPTDIGATFIHGAYNNPVTKLAEECGQGLKLVDYDSILVYGPEGGRPFENSDFHRVKDTIYDPWRKHVMSARDRRHRDIDLKTAFEEAKRELRLDIDKADYALLSWHFFWEIVQDQIAQVSQLSTIEYDASTAFEGPDYMLSSGMDSLVQCLVQKLKDTGHVTFTYNATVESVDYTSPDHVRVHVPHRLITADAVIVTLPLGTLQRNTVTFTPPLPRWKRRALHRLGCAPTLKVGMRFETPVFWPTTVQFFGKVGKSNTGRFGEGNLIEFLNMDYHHRNGVLVAEIDGEYATEALHSGNVTAILMSELRLMFGSDIPWPLDVRINDYIHDPAMGGCGFSFWPPFSSGDDNLEVGASIGSHRVYFAGEHTTPEFYANLHGALIEGASAADRLERETSVISSRAALEYLSSFFSYFTISTWTSGVGTKRSRTAHFKPRWCPASCQ